MVTIEHNAEIQNETETARPSALNRKSKRKMRVAQRECKCGKPRVDNKRNLQRKTKPKRKYHI